MVTEHPVDGFTVLETFGSSPIEVPRTQQPELRALLSMRDMARELLQYEATSLDDTPVMNDLRLRLRESYEMRRIAAMAEVYGAVLAPHCPLGPIALAACLQVGFATPNLLIQEQSLGIYDSNRSGLLEYLVDPSIFAYQHGYVPRLVGPGLGIEIDAAAVERAAEIGHHWRNPVWRLPDGGRTEW